MPTASEALTLAALAASTGTAAAVDIRTRRVPNLLTASTAALGLTLAALGASGVSVGASAVGFALGMLLMMPGHALGATGAGDVKLMGAVGAILGWDRVVFAFLLTGIAGGILAVGFAIGRRELGNTLARTGRLVTAPGSAREEIESPLSRNRIPYAPAIAAGSLLAALWGG